MIYKHFGLEVIENICKKIIEENKENLKIQVDLNPEIIDHVYHKIYKGFIMGVDGIDNGVDQYPKEIKPFYPNKTSLWSRIGRL